MLDTTPLSEHEKTRLTYLFFKKHLTEWQEQEIKDLMKRSKIPAPDKPSTEENDE